jgi:uncharacterized protein involved in exopolysaccharide biosynthesis
MSNHTNDRLELVHEEDRISLIEVVNPVLRSWRIVVCLPLLLALLAGVWSTTRERTYIASASFMPQVADTRGTSGAAALAQQFGVSLGAERAGQSPQFFVDLLRSRSLLRQVVEADYQIPTDGGEPWSGTLVEYWDINETDSGRPPWLLAIEILENALSSSVNRETGIVRLHVTSDHPLLAERIAESLLELLNEFNLSVRQGRAQDEGRFIRGRTEEAQAEVLAAERGLQEFLRNNRDFRNSPELTFEHDRLQRQVAMRQEVLTSLLRAQEQARIDGVRDIPLLTVIDHPAGTARPQGKRTVLRVLVAMMLGLIISILLAFIIEFGRRSGEAEDPHYREFQRLVRETWRDFRNPRRWMRSGTKEPRAEHRQ